MKKTYFVIVLFIFILQITCGCKNNYIPDSSDLQYKSNVKTMTIEMLPSPPTSKSTSDENVIKEFIKIIDECEKKEIASDDNNGWQVLVSIQSGNSFTQYSITNNNLRINDKVYEINGQSLLNEIACIYNKIQE